MNKSRLTETLPVRIDLDVDARIKKISKHTTLTRSTIVRLAIKQGLPLLESGEFVVCGNELVRA